MNREQELEQRIERLEEKLRNSQRDLDAFLYAVSHDIRGPLRSILATSVILREDFGAKLGQEGLTELERQSTAAKKIAAILDSILKLSRLGREELRPEQVDLSSLACEVGRATSAAMGCEANVNAQPELTVAGDPRHLQLMLAAIFENSIKFAEPSRPLTIDFGAADGAYFVKDNGIGFDNAQRERIFKPFEKLNRDSDYPGMGIGLSLVRMVAQKHDGEVWAEGEPGAGATLWFTIPSGS